CHRRSAPDSDVKGGCTRCTGPWASKILDPRMGRIAAAVSGPRTGEPGRAGETCCPVAYGSFCRTQLQPCGAWAARYRQEPYLPADFSLLTLDFWRQGDRRQDVR